MKFSWKSTAALLLGLTFAFTGVACTDSSGSVSSDSGNSGSSDSGSDVSSDLSGDSSDSGNSGSSDSGNTEIVGADYVTAAFLQMSMAQGAKIVFGAEVAQTQGGVTSTVNLDGSILLALTADGTNAKLDASVTVGEDVIGGAEVYYIDGCVYTYDEEIEAYLCVPVYAPTETVVAFFMENVLSESVSGQIAGALLSIAGEQISEAIGQIGGMEFDPTEMLSAMATLIEENGEQTEDGGLLLKGEYSVKEELSALVAVINGIDEETTTIEEFVDDYVLSAIDPELTLSDLIDAAGAVAALTVSEVYDAVDGFLTENYEIGLQDVWELALATEEVNTLLAQFLDAETIESLSQTELADLLEYQLFDRAVGDYTLYELFVMAFVSSEDGSVSDGEGVAPEDPEITETPVAYTNEDSAEEGEEPTVEEQIAALVAYAKEFVSETTLADIEFYFPAWDNLVITAAKATGEVKFGADYKIVSAKAGVEFGVTGLPVVDETSDISAFAVKIYVGVEEISSVASTIALPADSDTAVMVAISIPLEGTGLDGYTAVVMPSMNLGNQDTYYYFSVIVMNGEGTMYMYSFTANVVSELPETMIWTNSDDETTIEVTFDFAAGTVDLSELSETVEADFSDSGTVEDPSSESEEAWTKFY